MARRDWTSTELETIAQSIRDGLNASAIAKQLPRMNPGSVRQQVGLIKQAMTDTPVATGRPKRKPSPLDQRAARIAHRQELEGRNRNLREDFTARDMKRMESRARTAMVRSNNRMGE